MFTCKISIFCNGFTLEPTAQATLVYIKKYLKAKERRIMKTQIFHHAKNIIFKKSSKRNQNPSRCYNSITNLKFQHKQKISFFKSPHIKIDLLHRVAKIP